MGYSATSPDALLDFPRRVVARQRGRPWLRLQAGVSLDGRTALPNGASQWINGDKAQVDCHAWRRRADAVLTGVGTVLADDPRLNVRLVPTLRQPLRVIIDSRLSTPPDARIFEAPGTTRIYAARLEADRVPALQARGATILARPDGDGRVDLAAVLMDLAELGVQEIHAEGGARLNGALVHARLVDEFLIYLAPKLLGAGAGLAEVGPFVALDETPVLDIQSCERIGHDIRLVARPQAKGGEA